MFHWILVQLHFWADGELTNAEEELNEREHGGHVGGELSSYGAEERGGARDVTMEE